MIGRYLCGTRDLHRERGRYCFGFFVDVPQNIIVVVLFCIEFDVGRHRCRVIRDR